MKPIVIILEDSKPRIDWFKQEFPNVDCVWVETVTQFFDVLKTVDASRLRLFILDHDLGDINDQNVDTLIVSPGTWPVGSDGKSGFDVVKNLDGFIDVPIIVWSINSIAAPKMVNSLLERGYIAAWIQFNVGQNSRLKAAIESQVSYE